LGFSDATGDAGRNAVLARQRAQVVADALSVRGLRVSHVDGFGAERPVASNDDESGRLRNRRVEAWIVDDVR
jgi:phosphate transport system substrate-binding protein